MNIQIDFRYVKDISTSFDDGVYTISLVFDGNEALTYGYIDKDKYAKDYMELISNIERIKQC